MNRRAPVPAGDPQAGHFPAPLWSDPFSVVRATVEDRGSVVRFAVDVAAPISPAAVAAIGETVKGCAMLAWSRFKAAEADAVTA